MMTPVHDPDRFYHCRCLDEEGREDHDSDRFYHCSCVEESRQRTCPDCGELPFTGHLLWCSALKGQSEYRPDLRPDPKYSDSDTKKESKR